MYFGVEIELKGYIFSKLWQHYTCYDVILFIEICTLSIAKSCLIILLYPRCVFTVSVIIITFRRIRLVIKSISLFAIKQFIFLFSEADINLSVNTERHSFLWNTALFYPNIRNSSYFGRLLPVKKKFKDVNCNSLYKKEKMQVRNYNYNIRITSLPIPLSVAITVDKGFKNTT